jgi:hypothetical protein
MSNNPEGSNSGNHFKYLPSSKDVIVYNVHNTLVRQHEGISTARSNCHVMNINIRSCITALFQFLQKKKRALKLIILLELHVKYTNKLYVSLEPQYLCYSFCFDSSVLYIQ